MARRKDENGALAMEPEINGVCQHIAYTATHTESAALAATTSSVVLVANTDCHVAYGATPVADTNAMLLPAKTLFRASVLPGMKFSVVQDAAGGTLYIQECK